jgi:rare lipoprotein A
MSFFTKSFLSLPLFLVLFLSTGTLQAQTETGEASYYADSFQGRPTASGEPYDRNRFTCAHRTLPFGTRVKVTRPDNGKSVVVTVNDRGPHKKGRIVDLSYAAAQQIGLVRDGIAQVRMEVAGTSSQPPTASPSNVSVNPRPNTQPTYSQPTYSPQPPQATRPPVNVSSLPLRDHNGNLITSPPSNNAPASSVPATTGTAIPGMEEAEKYTPALYQFMAFKLDAEGYGVQVGAFFNFYKLMKAMDELAEKGVQNTMVQSSLKDGKPVFRILVGPYKNRAEANSTKKKLERQKVKGIVVDLAALK